MPRINLLPWRAEERKLRQRNFLFAIVGATLAAGVVVLLVNLPLLAQGSHGFKALLNGGVLP